MRSADEGTGRVPSFTVVVPALDEAELLPRTLESLARQDHRGRVEIVVVDNGSTDRTATVAREGGARVVAEPVRGVCRARQRGVDAATGDVVVSTDADTTHPPDWLSRMARVLVDHPDAVAVAGPCRYATPPWWARVAPPLGFGAVDALHRLTGRVAYLTATNVAFRREGFPGYDTALTQGGDEVDLLRRLQRWGPVRWDPALEVTTSSRRLESGLAHTVVVSYGWYYASALVLGRLTSKVGVGVAPTVRGTDRARSRRRRRQWRAVGVVAALAVTAVRLDRHARDRREAR